MLALKQKLTDIWRHRYILGTVYNFCSVLFGSGWMTTPLTAIQMGLVVSSLSMVVLGLVNAFACTVMLQAAEEFGTPESYHDLTEKVLGSRWASFLDASVALAIFFACCQRLILVGDFGIVLKHRLITQGFWPNRPLIVLLLGAVFTFPLVYTKRIQALERVSLLAIICTLTGFAILLYTFIVTTVDGELLVGDIVYANWSPDLLLALPIQQFAFAGQSGVIPIYREMRNRSLGRGKLAVYISFSICALLYLGFGILGYLLYPGALEANFLNLYEEKPGALYTAIQFIVMFGVIGAFPVNLFVGRLHLGYLLVGTKRSEEPRWAFLFATMFTVGSIGVAVAIKNLGVVQGIGGGVGDSFINLVVPGYCLLKLIERRQPGAHNEVQWHSNGLASEENLQSSKAGKRLEGKEHEHPGVGKDDPTDLSLKLGMDASNGTIENEGVSKTFVGD
jgi:amino acid permease